MLPGIKIYNLKKNSDDRGFFLELLRKDWKDFVGNDEIAQINLSMSYPEVIRAWHRHSKGQIDYICAVKGKLRVCVYDDREGSETKGQLDEINLNSGAPQIVRIPGFYWHGTKGIEKEPTLVFYMVTKLYDHMNPDEERREWDDPSIVNPKTKKSYDWNK